MPFSDTTNKTGLIQRCEKFTNLGYGGISGSANDLLDFTVKINDAFDELMPLLLSFSNYLKWDDTNQTDLPIGTINMVSGQADYTIAQDDNSLDILNITQLEILPSSSASNYIEMEEMTIDDPRAIVAMAPNSSETGVPVAWLKRGNTVFLYPKPNYASTNGIKIFFEREASYFSSIDTTKEAGIPRPFQLLLALRASLDWLLVNKPANTMLISRIEIRIAKREQGLRNAILGRNPRRTRLSMRKINYI